MGVNEKILEAIGICADNIVKKAGYNKTIQAQIMSCQDATIGKYKCKFQDAIFYAYNTNTEVSYTNGTNVYVLIPSNDMGKEKIILGATKKLGINYISQASDDEAYELVGQNCINNNNIYYLDTNYINYTYDIYNYERDKDKDNDVIDIKTLEYNLKHSTSMLVGATIKTNIDTNKQRNGHYGITYTLRFYDNVDKEQTTRTYILDEDSMISNPYKLVLNTRQYQVFHIDGENFIRVDAITIFNLDFPEANLDQPGQKPITSGDIILSKLELYGANALSEQQINGIAITFYTPQGIFFTDAENDTQKIITAQVRIKGKLASSAQNIPFFWGRENVRIGPKDEKYNKYLGRGWECLNQYTGQEWVPGNDTFILLRDKAPARNNKLKVAIVYSDNVITKQINIQNHLENAITINIQSDGGTEFHHDIGHPNLTCLLMKNNEIIENDSYSYYWSYYSTSEGNQQMPAADYIQINKDYEDDINTLNNLRAKELTETYKTNLQEAEQKVQAYDYIQRVQGNKIYNVQIRKIVNFKTFKCSVYNENQFLGTGEITLTNKLQSQDLYSLVINNGSVVYQYNENGVAPNNKKLQNPQIIPALTFNLYDDNGKLINSESLIRSKECQVTWTFPKKDTLLVKVPIEIKTSDEQQQQPSLDDSNDDFCYYKNILNLPYNIATNYNINKQNNQIILNVKYKGKDVTARTNFTFTKQGQPGTNGTEYIVKIVPNTMMNNPPLYPMITKYKEYGEEGSVVYHLNYGIGNKNKSTTIVPNKGVQKYFNVQLWRNGELVNLTNSNDKNTTYTVLWEVLKNKNELSNFEIKDDKEGTNKTEGNITFIQPENKGNLSNIIKCSITIENKQNKDKKTYYGTIPIITAIVSNEKYQIQLKENSGFRYVLYSSDGVFPQYDSVNPFEIICKQKIGDFWEDISSISGNDTEATQYQLQYNFSTANEKLLKPTTRETVTLNQKWYKPVEELNGYDTNAAVTCKIQQGENNEIASIHIPIHFLLNRYGLAHLNDWDGNSIQINESGGYILAPQMGAGVKNEKNTFTGVLMGEIIQPGKNNQLRIDNGLMGFHQGQRSFFIDSETGGAFFGPKKNGGQIIIDPSQEKGLIYSYNFFERYNDKGFPESYIYRKSKPTQQEIEDGVKEDYSPQNQHNPSEDQKLTAPNCNGKGMIINLTEPQIYFGSGSFYVTREGYIHAAGGGSIAGWDINDTQIYTNDELGKRVLTLQSATVTKYKRLQTTFRVSPKPPDSDSVTKVSEPEEAEITEKPVQGEEETDDDYKKRIDIYNNIHNKWEEYRKYKKYLEDLDAYKKAIYKFEEEIEDEIKNITNKKPSTVNVYLKTDLTDKNNEHIYQNIGPIGVKENGKNLQGATLNVENGIDALIENADRKYEWMDYYGVISYRQITESKIAEFSKKGRDFYYIPDLKQYVLYIKSEDSPFNRGKIYSNAHDDLFDTTKGFYLSDNGLSMGSKVYINSEGIMRLGAGAVSNTGKHWTIDAYGTNGNSAISYGTQGSYGSVYLGTDMISLGADFWVNNNGTIMARAGTIGGWKITESKITAGEGNLTLHKNGIIEGSNWSMGYGGFTNTNGKFTLDGGSLTSPGGVINAGGSGWLGNTGTMRWGDSNVNGGALTMQNGAYLGNFKIDNYQIVSIKDRNLRLTSNSIHTVGLTIHGELYPDDKGHYGRSGTVTFSDNSTFSFKNGILISVTKGSEMKSASGNLLNQ